MKKITPKILKTWDPCADGYKRFCELLPKGGILKECIDALVADGHDDWGKWLFERCKTVDDYKEQTLGGNRNSGHSNSGNWNSGHRNSGHSNSGNSNSGNWNSGHRNSGDWNSGHSNSGNSNSGNRNSGHRNSGDWNSGHRNSGDWNSGDSNSGFFNSKTPDTILVFNKPCSREKWENANKPDFIFFDSCEWISESDMTNQEKIDNPNFHTTGGYLKKKDYKQAWADAYSKATPEDIKILKALPNFDAEVFEEISGIKIK